MKNPSRPSLPSSRKRRARRGVGSGIAGHGDDFGERAFFKRADFSEMSKSSAVTEFAERKASIGHPVFIKGFPTPLDPIYGVRGASLYYIAHSADSVKLAIRLASK